MAVLSRGFSKEAGVQVVLGIDIGGTSIKAGVFSLAGSLLASASVPTGAVADEAAYARVVRFLRGALYEAGADKRCDLLVTVIATAETRLRRIIERDHLSAEDAQKRIRAQHPDEFYTARAHKVFSNDGTEDEFRKSVQEFCQREMEILSTNRANRLRSYQTLGLCAGAAMVILFI
jgi:hypothetical protein